MTDRSRLSISALFVGAVLVFGPAAYSEAGTLTLDDISPVQRTQFVARLEKLAHFEGGARVCGKPTNVEARLSSAVRECLTPDSLSRVLSMFREKLGRSTRSFDKATHCGDGSPRVLAEFKTSSDQMVSEAAGMCKACLATGMCK